MNKILKFQRPTARQFMVGSRIANALEDHIAAIRDKQIKVVMQLEPGVMGLECSEAFHDATGVAIRGAVERSPKGGEILLSATYRAGCLDVEVADDGEASHHGRNNAFAKQQFDANGIGIRYTNCPQGGVACIVSWQQAARRAIAA